MLEEYLETIRILPSADDHFTSDDWRDLSAIIEHHYSYFSNLNFTSLLNDPYLKKAIKEKQAQTLKYLPSTIDSIKAVQIQCGILCVQELSYIDWFFDTYLPIFSQHHQQNETTFKKMGGYLFFEFLAGQHKQQLIGMEIIHHLFIYIDPLYLNFQNLNTLSYLFKNANVDILKFIEQKGVNFLNFSRELQNQYVAPYSAHTLLSGLSLINQEEYCAKTQFLINCGILLKDDNYQSFVSAYYNDYYDYIKEFTFYVDLSHSAFETIIFNLELQKSLNINFNASESILWIHYHQQKLEKELSNKSFFPIKANKI